MILWFRNLPPKNMDFSEWKPFIRNAWCRKHFMKFVYLLMVGIFVAPSIFGDPSFSKMIGQTFDVHLNNSQVSSVITYLLITLVIVCIFIIHEILHIIVIFKQDDISLTHSGIFFWLNTNAILSKKLFWLFISLPVMILSAVPGIASIYFTGNLKAVMLFICWVNLIISSSDIINSLLILIKPNKTVYCRGYYRTKS
ncbi:hypothetical protein D3C87_478290 [compost metagenome]